MSDQLDIDAMLTRFRERAEVAKQRTLPPVGGEERRRVMQQRELDYMDFAIVGDASWTFEGGVLTLSVDFNPPAEES
ncbi:MAG: hypothetical protein ACRBI6_09945 [Acidimicrobiales bacterium]